jgi:tRNA threonylcarbamoyladenosine biosynthesis protein TsaE
MILLEISTLQELSLAIRQNMSVLLSTPVLLLEGNMGAGKTALVKELVAILNPDVEANSPTFSIINEYILPEPVQSINKIIHADLYRLKDPEELFGTGLLEYIDKPGILCIIEWPSMLLPLIDTTFTLVEITIYSAGTRVISIQNSREII